MTLLTEKDDEGGVLYTIHNVDECELDVRADPRDWMDARVVLRMFTCEGEEFLVHLDGLHVVDIAGDAQAGGLPVKVTAEEPPSHRHNGRV